MPPGPPAHMRLSALQGGTALPAIFPPVLPEMTPESLATAANAYKQPAPPPTLPLLQLAGRHQEPFRPASTVHVVDKSGDYTDSEEESYEDDEDDRSRGTNAVAGPSCPLHRHWPPRGEHPATGDGAARTAKLSEAELDNLVDDLAVLVRREYDCWVEACWNEAFHHVFTHSIPTFIISLILAGASPSFMRKQIVHGGPALDVQFMHDMLDNLYAELDRRLSGHLLPEGRGESSAMASAAAAIGVGGLGAQPPGGSTPGLPRDGVCTHDLAPAHGAPIDDDDDHAACLCQLAACPACLHAAVAQRKAPASLLPHEYVGTTTADGWAGDIETEAQATARLTQTSAELDIGIDDDQPPSPALTGGKGFAHVPRKATPPDMRRPQVFPHPQMTDVLAVEEHLRWRLKELGADDPSVIARYGPSVNAAAALEGLERALKLDDDDGSEVSTTSVPNGGKNGRKMAVGRSKARFNKPVKAPPKAPKKPERKVYLPEEWAKADPALRNTAIVLTFRHFVKAGGPLLHRTAMFNSPFAYRTYGRDVAALDAIHPVALYRRLTEQTAQRRRPATAPREGKVWSECMDKWTEELGAREKAAGNVLVNAGRHDEAVKCYTRAISLDGKKTVYYSNRAVALNTLGRHAAAEADCTHILSKDGKNSKAFYQRALARKGLARWREAEADLKNVLRLQPGNDAAQTLLAKIKPELAKLPKQKHEDVLNF